MAKLNSLRLALLWVICIFVSELHAEIIHEERSLYRDITVRQENNVRCMLFNIHRFERNQSCVNIRDQQTLHFTYSKMSLAGLMLVPNPSRMLVVGGGGGSIPMALSDLFPNARIDVVEIDEAVTRVAEDFFYFEETDNMKMHVEDGRLFVKRAGFRGEQYDYILLDAFFGDYMPEHMLTREFLTEVKGLMHENSVLVANTFSRSQFYHHESVTYQEVFGEFYNFKLPGPSNRIIIAMIRPLLGEEALKERAEFLAEEVRKYGVPIMDYPQYLSREIDWDTSRRSLTDQYSPGNLLRDN